MLTFACPAVSRTSASVRLHAIEELDFISAGINQARRAWLEAKDVLNTRSLSQLMKSLHR